MCTCVCMCYKHTFCIEEISHDLGIILNGRDWVIYMGNIKGLPKVVLYLLRYLGKDKDLGRSQ